MSDKRTVASYLLSISIFSLAAALFYFTLEVSRLVNEVPMVVGGIETISTKIEPIINQIDKVQMLVKPILSEVAEVRKQIPSILKEVKQTRALVNPILKEVKLNRELVPSILKEVKQTREIVPSILTEVKQTRALVPPILKEVKQTRESIPALLAGADEVVVKAAKIGKSASEDAVAGLFTGLIKAPFKIVGGAGSMLFGSSDPDVNKLTALDHKIIKDKLNEILTSGKKGETETWKNAESGRRGSITLLNIESDETIDEDADEDTEEDECREFNVKIWLKDKLESHTLITACLSDGDEWEVTKREKQRDT